MRNTITMDPNTTTVPIAAILEICEDLADDVEISVLEGAVAEVAAAGDTETAVVAVSVSAGVTEEVEVGGSSCEPVGRATRYRFNSSSFNKGGRSLSDTIRNRI